jgi:hypothetical protein
VVKDNVTLRRLRPGDAVLVEDGDKPVGRPEHRSEEMSLYATKVGGWGLKVTRLNLNGVVDFVDQQPDQLATVRDNDGRRRRADRPGLEPEPLADVDQRDDLATHIDEPAHERGRPVDRRVYPNALNLLHLEDIQSALDVSNVKDNNVGGRGP